MRLSWVHSMTAVALALPLDQGVPLAALSLDDDCPAGPSGQDCALSALQRRALGAAGRAAGAAAELAVAGATGGDGRKAAARQAAKGWGKTMHCANSLSGQCIEQTSLLFHSFLSTLCEQNVAPLLDCIQWPCEYSGMMDGGCREYGYNCTREWSGNPFDKVLKYTLASGITWYRKPAPGGGGC